MQRLALLWTLVLLALSSSLAAQPVGFERTPRYLVLISIDGLRPEFYLDGRVWPAPTIQEMAQQGVHARKVRGVFPSVTYPSHTTLVTGALPVHHGVFNNRPFEAGGQTGRWYWEAAGIRSGTLWDAITRKGGKTAAVSWPVTVGARIDYNLPEFWSIDPAVESLQAQRGKTRPESLWEELEREATGKLDDRNFNINYMARDDTAGQMAAYLLATFRPMLLAVHLTGADHFQHQEGREGNVVRRAVATVDRAIGRIREAAEVAGILPATAFIVTGDHGFVDVHSELAPNVWLADAGLLENRPDRGNWKAAFHTSGGSALLYLKDRRDEDTREKVRAVLARVPEKYRRFYRLIEGEELARIGADPEVVLALSAEPGFSFTSAASGAPLRAGQGGAHGYFPDLDAVKTGFIGWGAGFRSSLAVPELGLEDIAPLVSALLDLDFEAPDGVLYPNLINRDRR